MTELRKLSANDGRDVYDLLQEIPKEENGFGNNANGMTYDQFWYGDPNMAKAYREAFTLKRKMDNESMWLQGIYVFHALQAVIGSAFGKSRVKYVEEPFDIFPKTKMEIAQEKAKKRQKLIDYLNSMITAKKN